MTIAEGDWRICLGSAYRRSELRLRQAKYKVSSPFLDKYTNVFTRAAIAAIKSQQEASLDAALQILPSETPSGRGRSKAL
jgi:hypothetical protein